MANLFLAPRSNEKSRENFLATLQSGYPIENIAPHLTDDEQGLLGSRQKLYIWGVQEGKKNSWKKLELGDFVAFYAKKEFVYVGRCILKKDSEAIARELWGNVPKKDETWRYVFFLDSLRPISIPLEILRRLGGYEDKMVVQGFMPLNLKGKEAIDKTYGSLTAFFDSYSSGLTSRDASLIDEISKKSELTDKEIENLDEITREKDIELLLLEWEQRNSDLAPQEVERKSTLVKRNVYLVRQMKNRFKNECQICGFTFIKKDGSLYSEVAHIKAISTKEKGTDVPSNMVVLCPNHHKMLDLGNLKVLSATQYSIDGIPKDFLQPLFRNSSN